MGQLGKFSLALSTLFLCFKIVRASSTISSFDISKNKMQYMHRYTKGNDIFIQLQLHQSFFRTTSNQKFANPENEVIAIVGDGAFMMTCMELITAASNKIAPKMHFL